MGKKSYQGNVPENAVLHVAAGVQLYEGKTALKHVGEKTKKLLQNNVEETVALLVDVLILVSSQNIVFFTRT